jgi:hypothetical protein
MLSRAPLLLAAIICLGALGSTVGPADAGSATITVDTTSDANLTACTVADDDCSLRGALNIAAPNDTIAFNIVDAVECFGDICPITPDTELAPIADAGLTINGYTQPSAVPNTAGPGQPTNAALKIVLNGTDCVAFCDGLKVQADNVTIKGLDVILFDSDAILINDVDDAVIEGNWIGVNVFGNFAAGNDRGVDVQGGFRNRIGGTSNAARNVVSSNNTGIFVLGSDLSPATDNVIQGNLVGLSSAGSADFGNTGRGIELNGADGNTVGGSTPGARNVVAGQGSDGVAIIGGSSDNIVIGNYIGTDITGSVGISNRAGVVLNGAGSGNTVGGTTAGARNVISGNNNDGVAVSTNEGPSTVMGNFIGTDATGAAAVPNAKVGVHITTAFSVPGPGGNIIGGDSPGERNVISGNGTDGVRIDNVSAANTVSGNYIGTNSAGTAAVPNGGRGVYIENAHGNTVGGTTAGARNVISGNDGNGVHVYLGGTADNTIQGNYVGTNAAGDAAIPNGFGGVLLEDTAGNVIGGTTAGAGNLISGNIIGIDLTGGDAHDNEVYGNFVGTNAAGNSAIPNTQDGIEVDAPANTIGATGSGRNLISGNGSSGVSLIDGDGNHVIGNLIGTTLGGAPLGNGSRGIGVDFADNSLVQDNTIAFNGADNLLDPAGVLVAVGTGNTITANSIHSNLGLGIDVFHQSDGTGGVSPNDPGDADTGGNNAQNFPELTSAVAGSLAVEGSLDSTPHTEFRLEFFGNDACDPSNHGEGQTFLGASNLTLDADGVTEFAANIDADPQPGDFLTSTATNLATGDTSEFSACLEIEAAPTTPTPTPTDTPVPTLTPTPSPTPAGTPSSNLIQGDVNCDGFVDQEDFQLLIEFAAGLNDGTQPDPCPDLGEASPAGAGDHAWGDVNCDGVVNALDALYVLAHTADIELPHEGCPAIGSTLT